MADILVRNIDAAVVERLKQRARRNGRSLQAEVALVLEAAANAEDVTALIESWRTRWGERLMSASSDLIREDRER